MSVGRALRDLHSRKVLDFLPDNFDSTLIRCVQFEDAAFQLVGTGGKRWENAEEDLGWDGDPRTMTTLGKASPVEIMG